MPPDPERVQAIFLAAAEITDRAERAAHLDTECHDDAELRKRVEVLLRAHDDSEDLPAAGGQTGLVQPTTAARSGSLTVGQLFAGRYKLREMLGEGGMGEVWVADQAEPIQRRIALKVIKTGLDSARLLARFEQERQALALMDHPNIAKVLDAGVSEDGQPYFIMELVKGLSLTRYCDEAKLSPRERLQLFIPICQAVQHAHQKGIIHRDLKPSNILIGLYDGQPVPKVIDFGVAKATGPRLSEQSIYTEVGSFVGTLEYMSPEQAELNNLDIDTRADVYSLGVLLYELLTGTPPFTRKQLQSAAFTEMLRIIREVEPPKPSTKLSGSGELPSIAANRHLDPGKLTRLVMGELDWIVMKCLEKERGRRYETAIGLGMDLQRYLADEAVLACPPSRRYRLQKFMRKNRGPVLAASFVALALLAGMLGTTFGLIRSNAAWREAVKAQLAASERAEGERVAKAKAEQAEAETLADYRASTDDAIEQLIGSKPELGLKEKTYLENTLKRWQAFANRQGDDERSRAIRAEGHFRVASLWAKLGRNEEARAEHQTALDILKQLVEQFPAVPEYWRDLARTHTNLGLLLKELARVNEARMEYLAAREIEKDLVAQYPTVVAYFVLLANTHNNLARTRSRSTPIGPWSCFRNP
jgi:serine/threonine protein kinase